MPSRGVSDLSLEQRVGQLFMAGFDGTEPTAAVRELIREYNLGGVIYFARNVDAPGQVASLSSTLQAVATATGAGSPLLIATDQEGGVVSRLDWGTQLPSQMLLGAAGDPDLARGAGEAVGRELATVGINMNFAPVLDVNNNPDNPVIGVRSFGESPDLVGDLGVAMAEGMQSTGVLACGKHFPGHGDTSTDSHVDLPVVDHDTDRLERVEFAPFRQAIAAGIDAIMTTHVSFPAITDDETLPATVSPAVQTGLLRESFGYDGVVITDCLEMDAIAGGLGVPEGAVRAIEAGCDVVLVSHTPERQRAAIEAVVEAVESGRIDEGRIDESVRRVQRVKRERGLADSTTESWAAQAPASKLMATEVAERGVTLVRNDREVIPFDPSRPLHVVGFTGTRGSSAEDDRYEPTVVFEALSKCGVEVRPQTVSEPESLDPAFGPDDQVLAVSYDARASAEQAAALQRVCDTQAAVAVLAVRNPYDAAVCPADATVLTCYDYSPAAVAAAARVLIGAVDATGALPVTLPAA